MNGRESVIRRRAAVGLGLAALAVVAAVPLLRVAPEPDEPAEPAPTVVARPDIGRTGSPVVYDVDFVDDRHGFALWGRCTDGADYRCERRLLVTEDGMRWTERGFADPELAAPRRLVGRVLALGANRIVLTDLAGGGPHDRFYSEDGGRTWRVAVTTPDLRVAPIPAGALLDTRCVERVDRQTECWWRRLVVTLPDSGERAWLANPPPLEQPTPERRPAADGSWWVSGRDPATGRWAVAVSRDDGRSWSVAVLPVAPGTVADQLSVAASGPEVYVLATGRRVDGWEPRSLVAILHSPDGGRGWTQTWWANGNPPRTLGGAAVLLPDGALLVPPDDVGPAYRSADGGRSFEPVLDGPRLNSVRRTGGGYLATVSGGSGGRYLMSADGVNWSDVRFG